MEYYEVIKTLRIFNHISILDMRPLSLCTALARACLSMTFPNSLLSSRSHSSLDQNWTSNLRDNRMFSPSCIFLCVCVCWLLFEKSRPRNLSARKAKMQAHFESELELQHNRETGFKILKDDAVKVLHSICQQIWKTQQWPRDWKGQFSFQSQTKAMPKNAWTTAQLHSSHMLVK